jgi:cytochrome c peroxidase
MHDGRFATLREVIDHYDSGVKMSLNLSGLFRQRLPDGSEVPKRLNLTEQDKEDLEAFLNSLTDDAFLADPKLSDPFR